MGRPVKSGADWFSHDTHAFYDTKIAILRAKHGLAGYGFYWYLLEKIFITENYELDLSDEEQKEDIFLVMCAEMGIKYDEFVNIINTCLKQGLFDRDLYEYKGILTSNGIKKRSQMLENKREYDKNRYKKNKKESNTSQNENEGFHRENYYFHNENENKKNENHSFHSHSIVKDSIVKNSKEKKNHHLSDDDKKKTNSDEFPENDFDDFDDDFESFDSDDLMVPPEEMNETIPPQIPPQETPPPALPTPQPHILSKFGLTPEQIKTITTKYSDEYISSKINQIIELNQKRKINNLTAYIIKSFNNPDPGQTQYDIEQQKKAEEAKRRRELEEENKRKKQAEEEESSRIFMEKTDLLKKQASQEDREYFETNIVAKNSTWRVFFASQGYNSVMIDSIYRKMLWDKYENKGVSAQ